MIDITERTHAHALTLAEEDEWLRERPAAVEDGAVTSAVGEKEDRLLP
jgi:hypothetical protein